jgi:hypothetical protein
MYRKAEMVDVREAAPDPNLGLVSPPPPKQSLAPREDAPQSWSCTQDSDVNTTSTSICSPRYGGTKQRVVCPNSAAEAFGSA